MTDETHVVSDTPRPRASIPPGEPEAVQRLVRREADQPPAAHRAEIDLRYRVKRYKELANRYRAPRAEEADVKRQTRELNLPPQLLRTMKVEEVHRAATPRRASPTTSQSGRKAGCRWPFCFRPFSK